MESDLKETINECLGILDASHYINLKIRINGEDREYEADWIKPLLKEIKDKTLIGTCENCGYWDDIGHNPKNLGYCKYRFWKPLTIHICPKEFGCIHWKERS